MYAQTDSDAHVKSRKRIMVNQARHWQARYPELKALGLVITDDTAELVCTVFTEHLKTIDPMAAMLPLTSMYEHLLTSGQAEGLGDGPRHALAQMYIQRGMATRALPHLPEGDALRKTIDALIVESEREKKLGVVPQQIEGGKRGHSLQLYLEAHPHMFEHKTLLHVAPEPQLTDFFKEAQAKRGCVYRPVEGMRPGHMEHHDLCELQVDDESVDTILCHHVLEHIVDDRKAVAEMYRVLRPGGVLNFSVPQAFYLENTADWAIPDHSFHGHVRTYGRDLIARFSESGFVIHRDDWLYHQPREHMLKSRALYFLLYNAIKPGT